MEDDPPYIHAPLNKQRDGAADGVSQHAAGHQMELADHRISFSPRKVRHLGCQRQKDW